jgi:hypothetical protein
MRDKFFGATLFAPWVKSEGAMATRRSKSQPTWTEVKAKLASFDTRGLLGLVQDLYAAHADNRTFLHARFGLGEDVLEPYKQIIDRWLWPDVMRNQDTSVSKAKQAISNYKKAVGRPDGLAELMVFYCEQAVGFCNSIGYQDENYFSSLLTVFERAVRLAITRPAGSRDALLARLKQVRDSSEFGYGVQDHMDSLLSRIQ